MERTRIKLAKAAFVTIMLIRYWSCPW